MSPEALRRRLAHGHVYPPDRVDTALANLFRPEVLGRLRQLSLLWLADRVEEQIERQRVVRRARRDEWRSRASGRGTRRPGGDQLVRRAARIAGRTGAHLVGVHVVSPGKAPGPDLERQRGLLVGLGGVYREIVSENVAEALAEFARVEQATQLVIGAVSSDSPPARRPDGLVDRGDLIDRIGAVDVHVVGDRRRSTGRPNHCQPDGRSGTPAADASPPGHCASSDFRC